MEMNINSNTNNNNNIAPSSPPHHPPPDCDVITDAMADDKPSRSNESGGRKSSKPLMEKRRRARINHCLTELQTILDTLNPENANSRQSKREKADILEQTVRLVKELRQRGGRGHTHDPHSQVQFRAGFNECMATVTHFLSSNQNSLNTDAKTDLMSHLANSLTCGNKPLPDRGGMQSHPRRKIEDSTNSGSPTSRLQQTHSSSSQSEVGNSSSSMNVVHPMPTAASTVSPLQVPARSASSTATVPTPSPKQITVPPGPAAPALPARAEEAANGFGPTRLIPIGIPIKVQSAGQILLLPSNLLNGSQMATQIIPVLSPPNSLAPGPSSATSIGSSGSAAVSPPLEQQSPPKPLSQNAVATAVRPQGAIMYASYPAATAGARAEASTVPPHAHPAAPYPVAFVAMGDAAEAHGGGQLEQLLYHPQMPHGFYLPANAPNDESVWRPW